jgi:hypothetical protein
MAQVQCCIKQTSLSINCAYARVAIRELSKQPSEQYVIMFKSLFSEYPGFTLPDSYFTPNTSKVPSQFDRDCARVNKAFSSKWHPTNARVQYESQFSTTKWNSLPADEKHKHSLDNCEACYVQFYQYQKLYPLKPVFEPTSLIHIDENDVQGLKEKEFVKLSLQELDRICLEHYDKTFKESLLKHAKSGIPKKPTATEKKREKRVALRQCCDAINKQFAQTAPTTVLVEDESLRSYQRKRLSQSFEKPPQWRI